MGMSEYNIDISNLVEGAGVDEPIFTALMDAVTKHIDDQFVKGRITADSYAQVYLGGLNTVLGQSLQFLLSKDKAKLEAELIEAQKLQINAETARIEQETLKGVQETLRATQEVLIAQAQVSKLGFEEDLVIAQTTLTNNNAAKALVEKDLVAQEVIHTTNRALGVIEQTNKTIADTEAVNAQKDLAIQQLANMVKEGTMIDSQISKLAAEVTLLGQKNITEQAQTKDSIDGSPVTGQLGKQKELYGAQIQGFIDNYKNQRAKIASDIYSVMRSTDESQAMPIQEFQLAQMILGQETTPTDPNATP